MRQRIIAAAVALVTIGAFGGVVGVIPAEANSHHACTLRSRNSDHDPAPDCWEIPNGLNPKKRDFNTDKDHDGLTARQEWSIDSRSTSDPLSRPLQADESDTNRNHVDDAHEDLDGDGSTNMQELLFGTDPLDATSFPQAPVTGCWQVPPTIASNGTANVSKKLQAVIDIVPDGSCLDLGAGARYRSNQSLGVFDRHDFTINGNGATIFTNVHGPIDRVAQKSERRQFAIVLGSNISVSDLTIQGPNPSPNFVKEYEFEAGLVVAGVDTATITGVSVNHVSGDFVTISDFGGGSGHPLPDHNVTISNGTFAVAGRQGVAISANTDGVTFLGNTFNRIARSGVDIELIPGKDAHNITFIDNTFSNFNLNWVSSVGLSAASDVSFIGNHLVGESMHVKIGPRDVVNGLHPSDWTFQGNDSDTVAGGSSALFMFHNTDGVTISDNVQPFYDGAAGIVVSAYNSCGFTVENNTFAFVQHLFQNDDPPPSCP